VTIVALAAIVTGCRGPVPPSAAMTGSVASQPSPTMASSLAPTPSVVDEGSLLLLTGSPGTMRLERVEGSRRSNLALPDRDTAWISTDLAGRILATTRDGRGFLSGPLVPGRQPVWRRLAIRMPGGTQVPGPPAFGSLAPGGSRAAFLAADFGTGGGFDVLLVDAANGSAASTARVLPVPRAPDGAPPAWLDRRLVLLTRERGDAVGATILDPGTSRLADGPGPPDGGSSASSSAAWSGSIAALSISADGSSLAVARRFDGPVEVHPARIWLAGQPTSPATIMLDEPDGGGLAWIALDRKGQRLAIVRTDADGDASAVTVHEAATGWHAARPIALPEGALRAVVAWLP
jgi:hypothetical protein